MQGIDIKRFRESNKIQQKALAEYLGVTRSFISLVETDKSKLPEEKVSKLLNNECGWDTECLLPKEQPAAFGQSNLDSLMNLLESQQETIRTQAKVIDQQSATIQQLIDQQKEDARTGCPAGCAAVAGA